MNVDILLAIVCVDATELAIALLERGRRKANLRSAVPKCQSRRLNWASHNPSAGHCQSEFPPPPRPPRPAETILLRIPQLKVIGFGLAYASCPADTARSFQVTLAKSVSACSEALLPPLGIFLQKDLVKKDSMS